MPARARGRFIDPMLLLRTDSLPNDSDRWEYQLKFDGYRAIAFKSAGQPFLRSRNDNDFSVRYSAVMKGLARLPYGRNSRVTLMTNARVDSSDQRSPNAPVFRSSV
jgi:ATP-dependent DNA ligase